jgi:two-component system sensor kinase
VRSARRAGARAELAACCHVARVALGPSAQHWGPLRGLPDPDDVCRQLRVRVDRGIVEAMSLRVMPIVADSSRHQALLHAARRIVTSDDAAQILAEVRAATMATTSAVAVDVAPIDSLAEPAEAGGVDTERVIRPIIASGSTPFALVADYPFGEAAQHEQSVDVLATLTGAVLERQALRREAAERIVAVQEAERGRIARDLHDELGHVFAGILERSSALPRPGDGSGPVDAVRELAKEGIRAVRTLAWSLRPDGLDDLGLEGSVEQLVEDCERMFGIPIDFTCRSSADVILPETVKTAVFRIVQEALTNVGKHSGASAASVLLVISEGRLRMIVEDDGSGIGAQPRGKRPTLGLSCIRERAHLLGGRVQIESHPGVGTTVMVEVPVNDDWCGGMR